MDETQKWREKKKKKKMGEKKSAQKKNKTVDEQEVGGEVSERAGRAFFNSGPGEIVFLSLFVFV